MTYDSRRKSLRIKTLAIYEMLCEHLRNLVCYLQAIQGATYREMKEADRCCGSAGIYNIVDSELSMEFLDYKMDRVHKKQMQRQLLLQILDVCYK